MPETRGAGRLRAPAERWLVPSRRCGPCRSAIDARAINVPLAEVTDGSLRSPADDRNARSQALRLLIPQIPKLIVAGDSGHSRQALRSETDLGEASAVLGEPLLRPNWPRARPPYRVNYRPHLRDRLIRRPPAKRPQLRMPGKVPHDRHIRVQLVGEHQLLQSRQLGQASPVVKRAQPAQS